ncbi:CDP-diacylglycerol--glycerol-3-phosphate 3-phosphatidyltransferase, partial [Rhizopus stolonifer]
VLPVIQMGPFYVRQDERLTLALLNLANHHPVKWTIHLTSGYFNFTEKYKQVILQTKARFRFLTASPEANGFFNSKGVSRFLPPAYTFIERQFYRQVKKAGRQDDISIEEYKREGWTYHAKGLWVSTDQKWPSATMIGSPNFGQRSSERDLEAQALVVTENLELRKALYKEVDLLHQHSEVVSNQTFDKIDRKVPNGVKIATAFVKTML